MVLKYKWNPFDDVSFDYGEKEVSSIQDKIDSLSDEDIIDSIQYYEKYLDIGKWPLDDSLMHKIREEYINIEEEENKVKTLIQLYNMISQEASRRMLKKYNELND